MISNNYLIISRFVDFKSIRRSKRLSVETVFVSWSSTCTRNRNYVHFRLSIRQFNSKWRVCFNLEANCWNFTTICMSGCHIVVTRSKICKDIAWLVSTCSVKLVINICKICNAFINSDCNHVSLCIVNTIICYFCRWIKNYRQWHIDLY
ncbi:hypothetical protein D3C72_1905210 [compost metagenome]